MMKDQKITIHNIKSAQFRQVHSDGASSGITPSGYINLNFYCQRNVIPKGTIYEVVDGKLGKQAGFTKDSKIGFVREYEFGVHMDIETCKSIRNLLDEKIKEFDKLIKKDSDV